MQWEIVKHPQCLNILSDWLYLYQSKPQQVSLLEWNKAWKEIWQRDSEGINASLDGRLPGWLLLPRKSVENRISGVHAHISNISSFNAIYVLCAHFLLWLSMLHVHSFVAWVTLSSVPVRMGSSAMYCKGTARWGSRQYPSVTAVWTDVCFSVGRLIACMGICRAQKSSSVALKDIPWALLHMCPGRGPGSGQAGCWSSQPGSPAQ